MPSWKKVQECIIEEQVKQIKEQAERSMPKKITNRTMEKVQKVVEQIKVQT